MILLIIKQINYCNDYKQDVTPEKKNQGQMRLHEALFVQRNNRMHTDKIQESPTLQSKNLGSVADDELNESTT